MDAEDKTLRHRSLKKLNAEISFKRFQKLAKQSKGHQKKRGALTVPKCAAFGFNDFPVLVKVAALGMFCGIVGAFVPHWAYISGEPDFYATFGLWHYCDHEYTHCELVRDNIMPGKEIPAWFVLIQYNFVIGLAMSLVVFAGLTHNVTLAREIRMGPTMYMAMECVGAISALEKFVSLYVFVTYFDSFTFLHDDRAETDYHGAFYCGVISFCCDVIITVVLFLEEEVGPRPTTQKSSSILLDAAKDYEETYYSYVNNGTDRYINFTGNKPKEFPPQYTADVHLHQS